MSIPRRSLEEVRTFVGNGAAKLIQRCMPGGAEDVRFSEALAFYMDYYDAHARIKTGPYPGVPELLASLKGRGVDIAVVSNKPDEAVRQLAEYYFPGLWPSASARALPPSPPRMRSLRPCACWGRRRRPQCMWGTRTWIWPQPATRD